MEEALGGCLCGAIRYAITTEPEQILVCHCPDCRRAAGAQSVAWLMVDSAGYEIRHGSPAVFASSQGVERAFCGTCGTTLSWVRADYPDRVDVTIGSLDDPGRFTPTRAVYRKHRVPWASLI